MNDVAAEGAAMRKRPPPLANRRALLHPEQRPIARAQLRKREAGAARRMGTGEDFLQTRRESPVERGVRGRFGAGVEA